MKSVFSTEKKIDRVWDLKGSRTGRKSKKGDSVGKDLDIVEEGKRLKFVRPGAKDAFLEQLRMDATFLARLGIMDYSLLLGMHSCKENGAENADPISEPPPQSKEDEQIDEQEPCRSNTPFRRGVLKRAATGGSTTTANDGFKALEDLDQTIASKSKGSKCSEPKFKDKGGCFKTHIDESTLASTSSSSNGSPIFTRTPISLKDNTPTPNPITSRSDEGIEGGVQLADGTVSVEEIYYCGKDLLRVCIYLQRNFTHLSYLYGHIISGIIDILQYYNARKIGETVMKQAAGNSSQDISCVDPESYGKRFVKFISNLADE
jgi:1-phosphatidylinositol-4-phosphate 5-kinase